MATREEIRQRMVEDKIEYLLVQFVPELYLNCTFWYSSCHYCTFVVPFGTVLAQFVPLPYLYRTFWYRVGTVCAITVPAHGAGRDA